MADEYFADMECTIQCQIGDRVAVIINRDYGESRLEQPNRASRPVLVMTRYGVAAMFDGEEFLSAPARA